MSCCLFYFHSIKLNLIYRTLTEKIVAALPKMKCPYLIEPHQIQGLDFINIFPVIQWLVKRSVSDNIHLIIIFFLCWKKKNKKNYFID